VTRRRKVSALLVTAIVLLGACQAHASPSASAGAPTSSAHPSASASARPAGWSVVTIGDSIGFAQDDCGGCPSFTTLFSRAIEVKAGMPVYATNLSTQDDLTGKRLVLRIKTSAPMRAALAGALIVIVSIGHNDTPWNSIDDPCDGDTGNMPRWTSYAGACVVQLAKRHGQELDAILTQIETLRAGAPTAIRVLTDYNDIIGWGQAPHEANRRSVEVLNAFYAETCRVAKVHHAICVDVYHSFNGTTGWTAAGDLLTDDYTAPSAKGQRRIADLLAKAGLVPLVPASSPAPSSP
jgi:lysophospholipase L1-like esterase